jgi:transposase
MTYPISFRRHVLAVKDREGLTFAEAAERFSVGIASLVRWSARLEPKRYERRAPGKIDLAALAQDVRDDPDAFQHERAARFGVTQKAIWKALRKLGVTHKKNPHASEGERRRTAVLQKEDRAP